MGANRSGTRRKQKLKRTRREAERLARRPQAEKPAEKKPVAAQA